MGFQAPYKDNHHGVPHYLGMTGRTLSIAVSVVATNGFLLFGYDQGVMSGIISAPQFNAAFPQTKDDSTWQGFVTAIYEIGCLFGALFQLAYGDKIGRRRAIIVGGIIMIIGVIVQITAVPSSGTAGATAQFVIGRTITGIGNGTTQALKTYSSSGHLLTFYPCPLQALTHLLYQHTKQNARIAPTVGYSSASKEEQSPLAQCEYRVFSDQSSTKLISAPQHCLLDRLRRQLRPSRPHLALPHRLPDRVRPIPLDFHDRSPRVAQMATDPRPPRRSHDRARRPSRKDQR